MIIVIYQQLITIIGNILHRFFSKINLMLLDPENKFLIKVKQTKNKIILVFVDFFKISRYQSNFLGKIVEL
jgi:hypothetical protein